MIKFNEMKNEVLNNFYALFEAEKRFQLYIVDNKLIVNYYNENRISNSELRTLEAEVEAVKEEIDDLETLYADSDEELKLKKMQLRSIENKIQMGTRERTPSKKVLLRVKEWVKREEVEITFALYLRELAKNLILSWKSISMWKIYRDFGIEMEIEGEVRRTEEPSIHLNSIFELDQ